MKILWVDFALPYLLKDASYPVGGWAVELRSWLTGAEQSGFPAGVLTWDGAGEYVGKKHAFDLVESYDPKRGMRFFKYPLQYIPAMKRAVRRYRPDVLIQACASVLTGMCARVAQDAGIPFIYRVANDMDLDERCRTRLKLYERWMYHYGLKKSDLVLCQNRYQLDAVRSGMPGKVADLLPNPFAAPKAEPDFSLSNRKYLAWVGVFQKQKNLPRLLRVARQLPQVPFRVAGSRGTSVDRPTEDALAELEDLPNVEFVGYLKRDQVMQFVSGAAALLNTSHYEGFSNTYLEAFGCGTPVIAPCGADPDGVIGDRGLGGSIDHEDGFAEAILRILDAGPDYEELSRRCRDYVKSEHDPAVLTGRLVKILGPLTGNSGMV